MMDDIKEAVEVLRKGGIILYPTDTIWGLGCDATNTDAVEKLNVLKNRPEKKSYLVLFDEVARVYQYFDDMPKVAEDMLDLADKPLTLILDGAKNVAENLLSDDGSLGIRVTKEEYSHELCKRFKKPIVSTSANFSGQPSAQIYAEIDEKIKEKVDFIANFRREETTKHKPSSIVKLSKSGLVKIIRE